MARNGEKLGGLLLYVCFGLCGRKEMRGLLKILWQSRQAIKLSFMNSFLDWVRLYLDDHSLTMGGFADWINFK